MNDESGKLKAKKGGERRETGGDKTMMRDEKDIGTRFATKHLLLY